MCKDCVNVDIYVIPAEAGIYIITP